MLTTKAILITMAGGAFALGNLSLFFYMHDQRTAQLIEAHMENLSLHKQALDECEQRRLRVKEELQRYQAELESKGYRMPDCDKEA